MTREMPMIEARRKLTGLPEALAERDGDVVAVTRRGKPVLAVMPWDLYEALAETLEVMGDREQMKTLRRGIREIRAGTGIPWGKALRELGR